MKSPIPIRENTLRKNRVREITPVSFFKQWMRIPTKDFRPWFRGIIFKILKFLEILSIVMELRAKYLVMCSNKVTLKSSQFHGSPKK